MFRLLVEGHSGLQFLAMAGHRHASASVSDTPGQFLNYYGEPQVERESLETRISSLQEPIFGL